MNWGLHWQSWCDFKFELLDLNTPKLIEAGVIDRSLGNHPVFEIQYLGVTETLSGMCSASFQNARNAFRGDDGKENILHVTEKLKVSVWFQVWKQQNSESEWFQEWEHLNCLCCSKSQQASFKKLVVSSVSFQCSYLKFCYIVKWAEMSSPSAVPQLSWCNIQNRHVGLEEIERKSSSAHGRALCCRWGFFLAMLYVLLRSSGTWQTSPVC